MWIKNKSVYGNWIALWDPLARLFCFCASSGFVCAAMQLSQRCAIKCKWSSKYGRRKCLCCTESALQKSILNVFNVSTYFVHLKSHKKSLDHLKVPKQTIALPSPPPSYNLSGCKQRAKPAVNSCSIRSGCVTGGQDEKCQNLYNK